MFKNTPAFFSFSVNDIAKAKTFYANTLGLTVSERPEGIQLQIQGNTPAFVYAKDNHIPATFTVLNFPVDNIEEAVDELTKLGVAFEIYSAGMLRTNEKGITLNEGDSTGTMPKMAWFKDPAGNFLSIIENPHSQQA